MFIGNFWENLSQLISLGMILVGRLGVTSSQFASQDLHPSGPNSRIILHHFASKKVPGHPTIGTDLVQ